MRAKFKIASRRADRRRSTLDTATPRDDATDIARTNVKEILRARATRSRGVSRARDETTTARDGSDLSVVERSERDRLFRAEIVVLVDDGATDGCVWRVSSVARARRREGGDGGDGGGARDRGARRDGVEARLGTRADAGREDARDRAGG